MIQKTIIHFFIILITCLINLVKNNLNYIKNDKLEINNAVPRVAHYIYSLYLGGMERGLSIITELFSYRNITMIIFTSFKSINEYKLSSRVKRYFTQKKLKNKILIDFDTIAKAIKDNKINILVNHCISKEGSEISKFVHNFGIKVIFFSHSSIIDYYDRYKFSCLEANNYDLFITLVNFNMLYMFSIKKINSLLMPNQMNFNISNNFPHFKSNKNIIVVGRPSPIKNYEFAVDVFEKVIQEIKDAKLQIVGLIRDDYKYYTKKILNKIKILEFNKNIIVTESTHNIESFYKNSSVYLMCSYSEGFPNVVSEAKSHGLATVIVGVTYITPANNGTINIFNYDVNETSKKIIELFSNDTYLHEMRKFAFENRAEISNEELLDRWLKIYKCLIMNNITKINKLKLKLNNYTGKKYLELDKMLIREQEDKKIFRVLYKKTSIRYKPNSK